MTAPITQNPEDILDLSDEEFAKLSGPEAVTVEQGETPAPVEEEPKEEIAGEEAPGAGEVDPETPGEKEEEPETEDDPGAEEDEPGERASDDPSTPGTDPASDEPTGEEEKGQEAEKPDSTEADKAKGSTDVPVVNFEAEYKKLMAPFKANGMEMQARNVEDAIQLMKMGAGFHKKMTALKPAMRQMKLLENNGLLDDEKLNYAIDLLNNKPEAIQKLLKDSKVDPLDIDVKADSNYSPTQRKVSDTELALDDVINEIRDTPTFKKTLNVVSKDWDESSQNAIATEPQIMATINGHMQDGTFDAVMTRVNYERSLGRLNGVSDLDAYKQMGNAMADEGLLYRAGAPNATVTPPTSVQPPAKDTQKDIERKQEKRAASPVKTSRTTAKPNLPNPLEMSDEDFAKVDINKYLKS